MPTRNRRIFAAFAGMWITALLAFSLLASADTPPPDEWDDFVFLPAVWGPSGPTPTPLPPYDFAQLGIHGVNMQAVTASGGYNQIVQSDATWIRPWVLWWADVEPEPGLRNWTAVANLEADLLTAAISGHTVMIMVAGTPDWAQQIPGYECGPIQADALDDFGRFMADAVERYSKEPFNVIFWEVWNEPDISFTRVSPTSVFGCWGDETDEYYGGRYYGEMLAAIYPLMKRANPAVQVMVGGILMDCDPDLCASRASNFLEGILVKHGGDFFDGISFHAYDYYVGDVGKYVNAGWNSAWNVDGPVLIRKAAFIRQTLDAYGVSDKFLADTELALLCPFGCDSVFEESKAAYLAQSYAAAVAEGLIANVWYDLRGGWRASSLLYSDLSPRPAFRAFQFSGEMLNDADYVDDISSSSGVFGYIFAQPTATVWLVWSRDGADHTLDLPQEPARVYDMYGTTLPVSTTLSVGLMPVYVEFGQ